MLNNVGRQIAVEYHPILNPVRVGGHDLKNRIVFGPHRTNLACGNAPSQHHLHYYRERAKGGASMVIMEGASVHPSDYPYEKAIFAYSERAISKYAQIAKDLHQFNCVVVAQLNHCGGQADSSLSRTYTLAPSPVPEITTGEMPKSIEKQEIEEINQGFVKCANNLIDVGLDGVEINAGQLSLLRQFLSPLTNFRNDEYGGSLQNRIRFCQEILEQVRKRIGWSSILGLRLCGDEHAPWAGLTPQDSCQLAQYLCQEPLFDYLAIETGSIFSLHMTRASMRHPEDYALQPVCEISPFVNVPVCATGSFIDPDLADTALKKGSDLVDMTRALIADPLLPEKIENNKDQDIVHCILCNQDCYLYSNFNPPLRCKVNSAAGRENAASSAPLLQKKRKKVLIAGGGPAGLSAAISTAQQGHEVILYEKQSVLGGQTNILSRVPGCERFQHLLDDLLRQCSNLNIKIQLEQEITAREIFETSADAVVAATGKIKTNPLLNQAPEEIGVYTPEQILTEDVAIGARSVILDLEGGWRGVGAALKAAQHSDKVFMVTADLLVSSQLVPTGEFMQWYQQASQKGIVFKPQTQLGQISKTYTELVDIHTQNSETLNDIATIVVVAPSKPDNLLYEEIKGKGIEIWAIGDCVAPRDCSAAIREGHKVGQSI